MPNCVYSEETKRGLNNSHGRFWSSEIRKDSHDDKLAATVINRQLRSYVDSYDHASLFVSCSYDHCSGAVTIILPENNTTILLISCGYRVFSLVTNDDKWQIYIECKLCVSTWHARVTIGPCPNPPSPTSAILYDRNYYDRNCFPSVVMSNIQLIVLMGFKQSNWVGRKHLVESYICTLTKNYIRVFCERMTPKDINQ